MKSHHILLPLALAPALFFSSTAHADIPNEPPSVQITSPTTGATFDGPTATFDVVLDAFPGDDGIASIALRIDGQTVATDMDAPYGFEGVEVGEGMHSLVAVAASAADQSEYPSTNVDIVVFAAGDTGTGDSGTTTTGDGGESKGCATTSGTNRLGTGGAMLFIGLLSLGLARRRRES